MSIHAKRGLDNDEILLLSSEMSKSMMSKTVAWLLWLFLGWFGGHRYYLGDTGYAVAMTLFNWMTLGIWCLVDAFFINRAINKKNDDIELDIINKIKMLRK